MKLHSGESQSNMDAGRRVSRRAVAPITEVYISLPFFTWRYHQLEGQDDFIEKIMCRCSLPTEGTYTKRAGSACSNTIFVPTRRDSKLSSRADTMASFAKFRRL